MTGWKFPEIDLAKCDGCGDCVVLCPSHAVQLTDGKPVVIKPEKCGYCADCEIICPVHAIQCPFEIVLELPGDTPWKDLNHGGVPREDN